MVLPPPRAGLSGNWTGPGPGGLRLRGGLWRLRDLGGDEEGVVLQRGVNR